MLIYIFRQVSGAPHVPVLYVERIYKVRVSKPTGQLRVVSINVGSSWWFGVRAQQPHWITADELIVASRDTTVLIVHADVGH